MNTFLFMLDYYFMYIDVSDDVTHIVSNSVKQSDPEGTTLQLRIMRSLK